MKARKVKQNWFVGNARVNLYELYCVWLMSKYPGKRPGNVTPEMVLEYWQDKDNLFKQK